MRRPSLLDNVLTRIKGELSYAPPYLNYGRGLVAGRSTRASITQVANQSDAGTSALAPLAGRQDKIRNDSTIGPQLVTSFLAISRHVESI